MTGLQGVAAHPNEPLWHNFDGHWDYFELSRPAGRAVYAGRVNHLLERAGADVRLIGAEAGHVVHVTLDDRDQLVDQVLATPDPEDRDTVAHAVELVRSRSASRQMKWDGQLVWSGALRDQRMRRSAVAATSRT